ncbi:hypothetical protein EVAR_76825_1 [Eumeta japonica]|uniref:Histone-lysine N-methyltransferase SETMAR n=1 Tax=Eumeta variegata TaxID=151549 RepID=A0A4C1Z7X5_EUMVA|nr:hypothetical protein EVAR_76825_1 [Eumeta japonica]
MNRKAAVFHHDNVEPHTSLATQKRYYGRFGSAPGGGRCSHSAPLIKAHNQAVVRPRLPFEFTMWLTDAYRMRMICRGRTARRAHIFYFIRATVM